MRRKGREESDRFLSLFQTEETPLVPRPFRGPTTMAITSRQKLNTQNIGENPGILSRSISGARCGGTGRALLNISLGSNLSCLVRVILLHGQTVTFLALSPSIVESFRGNRERRRALLSLFLSRDLKRFRFNCPFIPLSRNYASLSLRAEEGQRERQRLSTATARAAHPEERRVRCASLGVKDRAAVNTNGTPPRVVVAASATLSSGSSSFSAPSRALCEGTTRRSGTSNSHRW